MGEVPSAGPTTTVATYDTYAAAQRAVDFLSDNQFPVEHVSIVGTDLRLVERVLGRITVARATGAGALSGAWFGLFIGLLLSIFANSGWLGVLLTAVLIGAAWGAIFGAVAHAMTRGRRDFASTSRLEAAQYAVNVAVEHADAARTLLTRLTWREANPG
ncbi:MAG TPA: general stress protein [Micromonosporaceae bacterium]